MLINEFGPSIQDAIQTYQAAPAWLAAKQALATAVESRIEYYQAADDDLRVYNDFVVDTVKGGAGNDNLFGSPLKDFIDGGDGGDNIFHVTGTNFNTATVTLTQSGMNFPSYNMAFDTTTPRLFVSDSSNNRVLVKPRCWLIYEPFSLYRIAFENEKNYWRVWISNRRRAEADKILVVLFLNVFYRS